MPGYKAHVAGGIVVYGVLLALGLQFFAPSAPMVFEWLCCVIIGALFPDIDIKSKGQKLFYRFFLPLLLLLVVQGRFELVAVLGMIMLVPMVVRHRGLFHAPWFLVALPLTIAIIAGCSFPTLQHAFLIDAFFFSAGALSHIVLDRGIKGIIRI